jgi:hypothetical protein
MAALATQCGICVTDIMGWIGKNVKEKRQGNLEMAVIETDSWLTARWERVSK